MAKNEIQKLILEEIQAVRNEVKEVRQFDIPGLHVTVATIRTELESVKEKSSTRSTIIAAIGGLIAVGTSIAVAYFK